MRTTCTRQPRAPRPQRRVAAALALALGWALAGTALADGGFAKLPRYGDEVLRWCNPQGDPDKPRCRVAALPGEPGYTQAAARTVGIHKNGVSVGRLFESVWTDGTGNVIFAMRIRLNANLYDETGKAFTVTEMFRQVLPTQNVSVAYVASDTGGALKVAGRTRKGLNELPDEDDDDDGDGDGDRVGAAVDDDDDDHGPARDNGWVNFRATTSAADLPAGKLATSAWMLVKTRAPNGWSVQPFAIRLLESSSEDVSEHVDLYLSGYQPN